MADQRGSLNANWRGGRSIASNGYVLIRVGTGHHLADVRGYAYEHRVVAENSLGRRLVDGEEVHHKDGNKTNNIPENLEVVTRQEHFVEHRSDRNRDRLRKPGEANETIACACGCGSPMTIPGIDWVIVGGESGPRARACELPWISDIVDQCKRSGVPVFVKQLGAAAGTKHPKGGDPDEWPSSIRVREFPR